MVTAAHWANDSVQVCPCCGGHLAGLTNGGNVEIRMPTGIAFALQDGKGEAWVSIRSANQQWLGKQSDMIRLQVNEPTAVTIRVARSEELLKAFIEPGRVYLLEWVGPKMYLLPADVMMIE